MFAQVGPVSGRWTVCPTRSPACPGTCC